MSRKNLGVKSSAEVHIENIKKGGNGGRVNISIGDERRTGVMKMPQEGKM